MLLTVGSIASSQSGTSPEEAPSPMEILAALPPASPDGAKTDAKVDAARKAAPEKSAERKVDHLAQCLRDWDAGTHMTRQEWARTCRRVVSNREQFLRERDGK